MISQFGETPGSLQATLTELIDLADYINLNPNEIRRLLTRLEGLLKMLDFFTLPREGFSPSELSLTADIKCHRCNKSWRELDACILNFAGTWLCRDHHPPLEEGSIRPPGWVQPVAESEKIDAARREIFLRLTREERRLINTRIGG